MKKLLLAICFLSITIICANAQRNCGSMEYLQQQLNESPNRAKDLKKIENQIRKFENEGSVRNVVTIPVVVHVVYRTSTENISDAQIQSQLDVLNDDFRRLNSDQTNDWSQAADSEIEFCLASVDPNGNSTTGITRTSTTVNGFGTNDQVKFTSQGGKDAWPSGDYLNFWVCNIGGGILGYAQFPGGPQNTDGVVNDYRYTGTIGTAQAPFDLGRTATHEVGHWLNLRHIWGDGGCGVDDFVSDTPTSDAANYGCASGHLSCGSTDMVENYMDYSDDACMNLFTQGQKTRMQALFANGGARQSITTSNGCGTAAEPTCTDGVQNGDETGVDCGGSTCPTCPTCSDGVQNGDETGVDCGGSNCNSCPIDCNENIVTVSITFDNYPEETSWTITNTSGTIVASGGTYGGEADGSTILLDHCLLDGCHTFTINDAYGDGICCSYGNGSYTVSNNGNIVASGGAFASSESTEFCLGGGPAPTCTDGEQNGDETGIDCGGNNCDPCPTCNDGIQNGSETGIDCGGLDCIACPTCSDGVQNGDETGVDCGGSDCAPCPTCDDGVQNGDETGVDCGGVCNACPTGCSDNEVTITITFDNYPEETSWTITNDSGNTVATGGTYGNQADGSTLVVDECLEDGCYTFTINDAYGDGICCSYGNGSYTVTNGTDVLASGGSFGGNESTDFCLGSSSAPTCTDGVQNGDETGIDCGGASCAACPTGGSDEIGGYYFETGWDSWTDGGSDCARYNGTRSSEGNYSIRIRDNTGTASAMTSPTMNLSGYSTVVVEFYFYAYSMENGEDFWLRYNDGSGWQTVATYVSGAEFNNNTHYVATVTLDDGSYNLVSNGQFRFQCDASANADHIYIDAVTVTGLSDGAKASQSSLVAKETIDEEVNSELDFTINPNPATDYIYVKSDDIIKGITITNLTGQKVFVSTDKSQIDQGVDVSRLSSGVYFITVESLEDVSTSKFVKE